MTTTSIRLNAAVFAFLLCCIEVAFAQTATCDAREATEAESVVGTATSWRQLHDYFAEYEACDDGAVGEGFSESVTILLADHWASVDELRLMVRSDPNFRRFVLRHVDESVPEERLKAIARNAGNRCPRNLKMLCRDIQSAVPH